MTQIAINKQIEAINQVTREALKTKESALKFLVDAGIVKEKKTTAQVSSPKINKK